MGFSKVAYLHCDGEDKTICECDGYEASSSDMGAETIAEYKKMFKKDGWLFLPGNKAYCPTCRKERNRGQK